jgi:hypothetical protein
MQAFPSFRSLELVFSSLSNASPSIPLEKAPAQCKDRTDATTTTTTTRNITAIDTARQEKKMLAFK